MDGTETKYLEEMGDEVNTEFNNNGSGVTDDLVDDNFNGQVQSCFHPRFRVSSLKDRNIPDQPIVPVYLCIRIPGYTCTMLCECSVACFTLIYFRYL